MQEKTLTEIELNKLAHAGTKEAINKIERYIKIEKDVEKKAYAEMALEECEFLYYQPTNGKEEEEFFLCELIHHKQEQIDDMYVQIENLQEEIDRFHLEQKVHARVLAHNKTENDWQYRYPDDYILGEQNRLTVLKNDLKYAECWIAEAKKC